MILCDFGNSRCKIGEWKTGNIALLATEAYAGQEIEQRVDGFIQKLTALFPKPQPLRMVSVLGANFQQNCEQQLQQAGWNDVAFLNSSDQIAELQIGYGHPEELGADRLAAMLGAIVQLPDEDRIVISCGTAITIDGVDHTGRHRGGLILPGRQNMYQALVTNTQQLPDVEESTIRYFAKSTKEGLYSGASLCLLHGVTGIVQTMLETMPDATVIMTGGDAEWMQERLAIKLRIDPVLVLRGIYEAFRE